MDSYQEFLERPAPAGCDSVRGLCQWSQPPNFKHPTPFAVFLDLIGYSEEFFGQPLSPTMAAATRQLSHVELSCIGAALQEYSNRPLDVSRYCRDLLEAEGDL